MSDFETAPVESGRRWPDWQGGRPILLPDGETWWFFAPAPVVRAAPGSGEPTPGWSFGSDVPMDVEVALSSTLARLLRKRLAADNDADRASAGYEIAWFSLARNYRVTQPEFEALLGRAADWPGDAQAALGASLGAFVADLIERAAEAWEAV